MDIVFYNRDFSPAIPHNFEIRVERYSHAMIGGPDKATFKISGDADRWELFKLLRCPVEIYGADGGCKWWGYVDRVVIPVGVNRVGMGLDQMYNSVTTKHSTGTLAASVDAQSAAEYGSKEYLINLGSAPAADAAIYQAIYLEKHKQPVQELELSGEQDEIVMECYGWWQTLEWCYYANSSITPIENVTQIRDIIDSCGQFIEGVVVNGLGIPIEWSNGAPMNWSNGESLDWSLGGEASGLTSTPTRDGSNTALAYITELLNAGSVNIRPMLAYVDKNRWLHVYERIAETTEYIMRDDGDLESLLGRVVEPENCLAAVWVGMKGAPPRTINPFFIERAEWVNGKVHYTSAGAFAQTRLDRYLQTHTSTYNGVPYVPPAVGYGGPPPDDAISAGTGIGITHDVGSVGMLFTTNLDAADPNDVVWEIWDTGLTTTQNLNIKKVMCAPGGAVFAANFAPGVDTFIARAPAVGEPFTVLFDYATISALYGGSSDSIRVCAVGQDKSSLEFVVIAVSQGGENVKFFISTGAGIFTQATAFVTITSGDSEISFGELHWMFTAVGHVMTFNAAMSAQTGDDPWGPTHMTRHRRVGATGLTYHWDDDGATTAKGLGKGEDNGAFFTNNIGDNLDNNRLYEDHVVCDDVYGINFMTRNNTPNPVRSSDGGKTFTVISGLTAAANWYFDVAPNSLTHWGAAGGAEIVTTDDFGTTWKDVSGNLTDLVASPNLNVFKFYAL